jgi:hypothetical protein
MLLPGALSPVRLGFSNAAAKGAAATISRSKFTRALLSCFMGRSTAGETWLAEAFLLSLLGLQDFHHATPVVGITTALCSDGESFG